MFNSYGEIINYVFLFLFAAICLMTPLVIAVGMIMHFSKLELPAMRVKYESLYENLNLAQGRKVIMIPFLFLTRRLLLTVAVVNQGNFVVQVVVLFLGVIAQFTIIGHHPYTSLRESYSEYFNELVIMLTMYSFFCFTDFVKDV